MTSPYDLVYANLLDNGFSPLPLKTRSKAPAVKDWAQFCSRAPTQDEADGWSDQFPQANVGVCLGNIWALDIDTDDRDVIDAIEGAVHVSPFRRRGGKGYAAFFRANEHAPVMSRFWSWTRYGEKPVKFVEFYTDNRQFVLPPSIHPDTEQPYTWMGVDTLTDSDISELPICPSNILDILRDVLHPFEYVPPQQEHQREAGLGVTTRAARMGIQEFNDYLMRPAMVDKWVPLIDAINPDIDAIKNRSGVWQMKSVWRDSETPLHERKRSTSINHMGIKDHSAQVGMRPVWLIAKVVYAESLNGAEPDPAAISNLVTWLKPKLGLEHLDTFSTQEEEDLADAVLAMIHRNRVNTVTASRVDVAQSAQRAALGLAPIEPQVIPQQPAQPSPLANDLATQVQHHVLGETAPHPARTEVLTPIPAPDRTVVVQPEDIMTASEDSEVESRAFSIIPDHEWFEDDDGADDAVGLLTKAKSVEVVEPLSIEGYAQFMEYGNEEFPVQRFDKAGGLFGNIHRHMMLYLPVVSSESAFIAAWGASLAYCGYQYKLDDAQKTRGNAYLHILGASGSGKTTAQDEADAILAATMPPGGRITDFASGAFIDMHMKENPFTLAVIDEIGDFYKKMRRGNDHMRDAIERLTKFYTASGSSFHTRGALTRGGAEEIICPSLSILGTSTAEGYWEGLGIEDIKSGFVARHVSIEMRHIKTGPESHDYKGRDGSRDDLITAINQHKRERSNQISAQFSGPEIGSEAITVSMTERARQILHDVRNYERALAARMTMEGHADFEGLVRRMTDKMAKLAMSLAVGRHPKTPVINHVDMRLARKCIIWTTSNMIACFERHGRSRLDPFYADRLEHVRFCAEKLMSRNNGKITRHRLEGEVSKALNIATLDVYLAALIKQKFLQEAISPTGAASYQLTGEAVRARNEKRRALAGGRINLMNETTEIPSGDQEP